MKKILFWTSFCCVCFITLIFLMCCIGRVLCSLFETKTIVFVAGESGGHIVPALELARRARESKQVKRIVFVSTTKDLDTKIVEASLDIVDSHKKLNVGRVTSTWGYIVNIPKMSYLFVKSFYILTRERPQSVVATGGLIAMPVCLAAWVLGIPITLYELNAVPGRAVRALTFCAHEICVCFAQAKKFFPIRYQSIIKLVDYPIRWRPDDCMSKEQAREQLVLHGLSLDKTARVMLVLGGSQGSEFLNTFARDYVKSKKINNLFVIHQAGSIAARELKNLKDFYKNLGIKAHVFTYESNLAAYYSISDFVIARAGAGTIFELLFFKKPALLIPLETQQNNHQLDNAQAITKQHPELFTVLRQSECVTKMLDVFMRLDTAL